MTLLQTDPAAVPSMADLMTAMGDLRSVAKVGEGSYGEAFRLGRWAWGGKGGRQCEGRGLEGTRLASNAHFHVYHNNCGSGYFTRIAF